MTRLEAPEAVRWIVRTLEDEGFETWTVGGAVRDALLGHGGGDWDLATRARPGDVRRIFERTVPIGIDHGTVGVLDRSGVLHEVTTFRRDVETFGRKARVQFSDTIDEDLARRDFTINAIAWHPLRDELRDPFGGADDLEAGLLRTVEEPEERFREDYLRVLRALRFAGRFDFRIDESTWTALCAAVGELHQLSPERIREELTKILDVEAPPSRSLELYRESGVLAELYPELEATVGHPRSSGWTEDPPRDPGGGSTEDLPGDLWEHALATVDALPSRRTRLRLAALLQGVGEPDEVPGHDDGDLGRRERGARRAGAVLSRLRFSNAMIHGVSTLVEAGMEPPPPTLDGVELRRWLHRYGAEGLKELIRLWEASARVDEDRGRPEFGRRVAASIRRLEEELERDPPLQEGDLALDGRDLIRLGLRPGPRFGEILGLLLDRVLEDPSLNEEGPLLGMVEEYLEEHPVARGKDREGEAGEGDEP